MNDDDEQEPRGAQFSSDRFGDALALIKLAMNPKELQKDLRILERRESAARAIEERATQALAALDARTAELDQREKRIAEAEVELHRRKGALDEQHGALTEIYQRISNEDHAAKIAVLRKVGLWEDYAPIGTLHRNLPGWEEISSRLGAAQDDPHLPQSPGASEIVAHSRPDAPLHHDVFYAPERVRQ